MTVHPSAVSTCLERRRLVCSASMRAETWWVRPVDSASRPRAFIARGSSLELNIASTSLVFGAHAGGNRCTGGGRYLAIYSCPFQHRHSAGKLG